jgi:hypothetical protein
VNGGRGSDINLQMQLLCEEVLCAFQVQMKKTFLFQNQL